MKRIAFLFTLIACLLSFGVSIVISARKASADSEQPKEKQVSPESIYTIQTGSFKDSQSAEKRFRIIEQSLEETALQALRIEMIGKFYAVRVGRFARRAEAEQFLREHELSLKGAMVMKAYFIDKRILLIHNGVTSKNDIKDFDYYHNLGLTYGKTGKYQEAVDAYKQAIKIKPDADAYRNLGIAYNDLGKHQEAVDAYKQAIRIIPDFAYAHYKLGITYRYLRKYQEAVDAYKQAIRIKPGFADAYRNLAIAYNDLGKFQETVDAYKQAIKIKPDADAYRNLGIAYNDLGKHQEAVDAYKQAIKIKPDFADAHYNLGKTYRYLSKHQEAADAYKQAIKIKPDFNAAHYNLGIAYHMIDDKVSALDEYKILKDLDKELANKLFNVINQ